ncbi:hypothetical protein AAT19DRAFT_12369 [Rhodotorula toruloides]|uniref:Uncharacterized protein n=1 Tax=Rhodotorula toruloides TaxID=5286 RepID=A0A2T0AG13_RHOTO|nr:hypothetical protein AAT19DRAFT_12369 [Rhodotorula toruloides]
MGCECGSGESERGDGQQGTGSRTQPRRPSHASHVPATQSARQGVRGGDRSESREGQDAPRDGFGGEGVQGEPGVRAEGLADGPARLGRLAAAKGARLCDRQRDPPDRPDHRSSALSPDAPSRSLLPPPVRPQPLLRNRLTQLSVDHPLTRRRHPFRLLRQRSAAESLGSCAAREVGGLRRG